MRNTAHNVWRKKKPDYVDDWTLLPEFKPAFNAEAPRSAEEDALSKVVDPALTTAVNGLAEEFRSVLILVDVEGFSYAECAEILGIPIGTVMSRRSRAVAKVRKSLQKAKEEAVSA